MGIFIFLGTAGSGKGTQAKALSNHPSIEHLSTGDLLRLAVENKTELGLLVEDILANGQLVSDDLVNDIVSDYFKTKYKGDRDYILDGYPRTLNQAYFFKRFIEEQNIEFKKLVFFELAKDEAVNRIVGRLLCPETNKIYHKRFNPPPKDIEKKLIQREDDSAQNAIKRYDVFISETKPILDLFRDETFNIDASDSIDSISKSLHLLFNLDY